MIKSFLIFSNFRERKSLHTRLMYVNLKEKHLFLYVQTERTMNGKLNQSGKEERSGCFYGIDGESDAKYV